MADVRGIYTIDRAGTATLVKNLEDGTGFFAVRDSVTITPAPRKQVMAAGQNRYEGSVQVGETHDNGTYAWQCLVAGTTLDDALTKAEALLGVGEAFGPGRYLGWSPAGATNISYCEIRGAFTFKPGYQPQQFVQTKTWVIDVSVPVAPLVRKAALQVLPFVATTTPAVLRVGAPTNPVPNPSIETSTAGWGSNVFPNLAALTRVATGAVVGTAALQLTTDGVTNFMGADIVVPGLYPVGVPQTFSIYMRGNVGGEVVALQCGTGADYVSQTFTLTTTPTRYQVTWTPAAPVTTSVALCILRFTTAAATWYADAAMVNPGTTAATYADGNSSGWQWTGTTNLSSSYSADNTAPGPVAITGNAPALVDLSLRTSGGSAAPIWALIAWWKRVTATPLSGSVAPIGIIEAESGTMTTWSSVANAAYRGGNGAQATTSGAGTAQTVIPVDPSVLTPDDFTQSTVDVEVWVDYRLASTVVSPRLIASLTPSSGFGATRYTELGAAGRLLTLPSTGTVKRFTRLGVLTMPVDTLSPVKWDLKIAASWAAGSSGAFGADYVMLVPVRQSARGRTGVANDSGFPKFIASTSDTTKIVRSDLSGAVASAAGNPAADTGLGGARLWLPPGNVDLLVKLSSTVPDDPTVDASDEQLSHTGVTGALSLVSRYWLAV